jgi:hemerythrin-like domain-containing protein
VLLLRSHQAFRETSRVLCRRARDGGDSAAIGWIFNAWKSGMHSHERYEEYKLYPYLERRWGLSMEALQEGHALLSAKEEDVRAAFRDTEGPASEALVAALQAHHDVLLEHLDLEEDVVIPALLALEPDEFEAYLEA